MKTLAPIMIVLLGASGLSAADQRPEVIVELGAAEIHEGQSVLYQVTLRNIENPSPPELRGFDDFQVALLGEQPIDSRMVRIVNGRRTEIVRRGRQYTYKLTPLRTGWLKVPAPMAKADGKLLTGKQQTLHVTPAEKQDVVLMEISAKPDSVYPTQPFTVTLSIWVKDLPKPYSDYDPLGLQRKPALQIPWAAQEGVPKGLEPKQSGQRWRESLRSSSGAGFSVNGLAQRDVMSLFDDDFFNNAFGRGFPFGGDSAFQRGPKLLIFEPRPRRVVRSDENMNDTNYWQYDFKREFVAKHFGQYKFGPVALEGQFVTGATKADAKLIDIYALARPVTVTVKNVPVQNRPDSYIGAIGQFQPPRGSFRAKLHPKKASVGDPMTLTLTLSGKGSLENASPPDLKRVREISEQFKVYEPTEEGQGNQREFIYSLRPRKQGIKEFPPVPIAYFDPDAEKYVPLKTRAIPIEVTEAARQASHRTGAAGRGHAAGGDVQLRQEGIYANVTDTSTVRDQSIRPGRWLVGLVSLAGLYAAMVVVVTQVRRLGGDVALRRRHGALPKARRRLRDALAKLKTGRARDGADGVRAAMVGLVADLADLPGAGLTPRDVEKQLRALGVEDDLVRRLHAVLDTCEAARYGASEAAVGGLGRDAEKLLKPLSKSLKAKKRFR